MAARHEAQIIRGPLSTSESAGRGGALPIAGAFPARARRGSPSSGTPWVANLEYFCSSGSWQGGGGYVALAIAQINACIETCGRNAQSVTVGGATWPAM